MTSVHYDTYPADILTTPRQTWDGTPESKTAWIKYYDVESLSNIFTVSIYDPKMNMLALFYLCDDDAMIAQFNPEIARQKVIQGNSYLNRPGVEPINIGFFDLKIDKNHQLLSHQLGLALVDQVSMVNEHKAWPIFDDQEPLHNRLTKHAFLADTHPHYDPTQHWMIAGYNSAEYDSSIMAEYFYQSESNARQYGKFITEYNIWAANSQKYELDFKQPYTVPAPTFDLPPYTPTTAARLREYNDQLFAFDGRMSYMADGETKTIRTAMMDSGRHLDVALLNEKQKFVKLKRLCGMLGFQILESEKLAGENAHVDSIDDVYDLLTYNASDTINLCRLFHHPIYENAFNLKASLLHRYPETVFNRHGRTENPSIRCNNVRSWRLKVDSTSAQIVARFLAPYTPLKDMDAVSFMYPSQHTVDQLAKKGEHIERFNVLDRVFDIFCSYVSNPDARSQLQEALSFYKNIEGRNFNDSLDEFTGASVLKDIPTPRLNVPYFDLNGNPTNCYVTFSTGGIHGAELNKHYVHNLAKRQRQEVAEKQALIDRVKAEFPDPTEMRKQCGKQQALDPNGEPLFNEKGKPLLTGKLPFLDEDGQPIFDNKGKQKLFSSTYIMLKDGTFVPHAEVLETGSTIKNGCSWKTFEEVQPLQYFVDNGVTNAPNKKLNYTSIGLTIHEDFSSYYPNLLVNMGAFYNPAIGEDRYSKTYAEKQEFGRLKKQAETAGDMEAFTRYDLLQKGTKLILNSASGAADSNGRSNIKLNNYIISMRIIGQLFTWIIGQLQTFHGAQIVSTNTDGLYSELANITKEANNQILTDNEPMIRVDLEPEDLILVSKDSNNRLELKLGKNADPANLTQASTIVAGASGSTLACFNGPNPVNSLAHAAVLDYVLFHYMSEIALLKNNAEAHGETPALTMSSEFNEAHARRFMDGLLGRTIETPETALPWKPPHEFSHAHALTMFQTIVTANAKSYSFPFASVGQFEQRPDGSTSGGTALQDVNRIFFVRSDANIPGYTPVSLHKANAAKINPAQLEKMKQSSLKACHGVNPNDPIEARVAYDILRQKGFRSPLAPPDPSQPIANDGDMIPRDREVKITKIPGIDPENKVIVVNEDIECMSAEQADAILNALDLDVYFDMAKSTFNNSWRNEV